MKVQNKVILVTGGGSGMGRALVLRLLDKGAKVAAVDINEDALQETKKIAGSNAPSLSIFIVDITKRAAVEGLLQNAIAEYGYIDGIINNAGIIQPFERLNDLSYEAIQRVIDVNFYGTLYMVKTFLPHLLTRPEAHILNISSMGGFLPVPGQTIYGATKAAVKLMTEGLNSELKDSNVKVTVAFPGGVRTNIMENSGLGRKMPSAEQKSSTMLLAPEEAANIMIAAIERNLYRIVVGRDAKIMDFLYRLNPKTAASIIGTKMKALLVK